MNRNIVADLRRVDIFAGLSDDELAGIARVSQTITIAAGNVVFSEGDDGNELYIIHEGCVKVAIHTRSPDGTIAPGTINMLYAGQSFGEMALLGGAARSATITAVEPCSLLMLRKAAFDTLCATEPRIGFVMMRNLADDLAYKLRSSNLLLRGTVRWQHHELGNM